MPHGIPIGIKFLPERCFRYDDPNDEALTKAYARELGIQGLSLMERMGSTTAAAAACVQLHICSSSSSSDIYVQQYVHNSSSMCSVVCVQRQQQHVCSSTRAAAAACVQYYVYSSSMRAVIYVQQQHRHMYSSRCTAAATYVQQYVNSSLPRSCHHNCHSIAQPSSFTHPKPYSACDRRSPCSPCVTPSAGFMHMCGNTNSRETVAF